MGASNGMRTLPIVAPGGAPELDAPRPVTGSAARSNGDLRDEDLHGVLVAFYAAVEADPLLAPYFASVDMPGHLPRIVDFWSTLLFHTGRYSGNAFRPHLEMPGLTGEHFERWLATLEKTVDAQHAGDTTERMKALAHRVASAMQVRLGITLGMGYRTDML
jgi:hemoglobin